MNQKSETKIMSVQLFEKVFKIPLFNKYPSLIKKEFRKKHNLPVSGFDELATQDKFITFRNIKKTVINDKKIKEEIVIDQEIISTDNKYIYGKTNYGVITGKKNGLVVLDLDLFPKPNEVAQGITSLWETEQNQHPFIKHYCFYLGIKPCENWYDTLTTIIKKINTFTVKTPNKGFHLYFKYNDTDLKNTQDKNIGVDIRGQGGYVVGCGSITNAGEYTPYCGGKVKDLSTKDIDYFYSVYATDSNGKVNKQKKEELKITKKVKDQPRDKSLWVYEMKDEIWGIIEKTIKEKSKEFFCSTDSKYQYKQWLKITTFLKFFDKKILWETLNNKWSAGVDYTKKNNATWESITTEAMYTYDPCICSCVLASLGLYGLLSDIRYRPLIPNTIKPDINVDSEGTKGISEVFTIEPNKNYVIKSRTNSGKTYLVNKYHHTLEKPKPLLSITSRVSLAEEHQRVFLKANTLENDMNYHLYCESNNRKESLYKYEGENLIIQLDSIDRIQNFDFSNYIVLVDELQSVYQYLDTSPTFEKKKRLIQTVFKNIIKTCHQFIGVDADICDDVLKYLNPKKHIKQHPQLNDFIKGSPNLDFLFINNEFHPYKDVEAEEINDYEKLVQLIAKEKQFMVCCDSQTEAHNLKNKIKIITKKSDDDFKIKVIDRLYNDSKDLDQIVQLIFSPAVIYGLDSTMNRKVFCLFKGHTISAKAMLQQVSRCRNIEKLYFYFMNNNNICQNFEFNSPTDVIQKVKYINDYAKKYKFNILEDEADISASEIFYNYRMSIHLYNYDSDRTNKKLHFKKGLENMKIKIVATPLTKEKPISIIEKKKLDQLTKQDMYKHFMDNFINKETPDEYYKRINEILNIPDDKLVENSELFINPMALSQHFNFINLFTNNKDESLDKLKDLIETNYGVNVVWSDDSKVFWLKNMIEILGINLETGIKITKKFDKDTATKEANKYKQLFRDRRKIIDFDSEKELTKILVKVITQLIGEDNSKKLFIKKRKDTVVDGVRKTWNEYHLHKDFIEFHNTIKKYRTTDNILDEYSFEDDDDEEDDINELDL